MSSLTSAVRKPSDPYNEPLVTIVIPSRNERDDIDGTLRACLELAYKRKEIIVVDDSTDDTAERVRAYVGHGVRLVKRARNDNGCCGARNVGMALAKGEIVVLLNADNRPRADFLTNIVEHYRNGTDSLVVRSVVSNRESSFWARYQYALELEGHDGVAGMPLWSEGFSVRRKAAASVGYIPGDFPLPFCRDNALSPALEAAGYVRRFDPSIELPHVVPATARAFWRNRVWRGTMAPFTRYYLYGQSLSRVTFIEIVKCVWAAVSTLLALPRVARAVSRTRRIGSRHEIFKLFAADVIDAAARCVGALYAVCRLWAVRKYDRREPQQSKGGSGLFNI